MIRATEPTVAGYPSRLADLRRPPSRLWLRGPNPPELAVAVVGTRRPTARGRAIASRLAQELAEAGYAVVSGLSPGIDCAAHRGAIEGGGRTWAVVGCGVDLAAAPASERDSNLLADILRTGGVISEVPPGTAPTAQSLVARDRIQSGLSLATVVVQTDLRSGTMHTARFTIEQDRVLAVVAADGSGETWAGNAALTDPAGCDPGLLHAKGKVAEGIRVRRPVADLVLGADEPIRPLLDLISTR